MIQKEPAKDKQTSHHGECAGVIRIGRLDEALVLVVAEGSNRDADNRVDIRETLAIIFDLESENSVDVR